MTKVKHGSRFVVWDVEYAICDVRYVMCGVRRMAGISLTIFFMLLIGTTVVSAQRVRVGADVLLEKHLDLLMGKRVGVVCNHTSILSNGTHLVDTLLRRGVTITALFAPEHGIRGQAAAGANVENETDARTGLPVLSLYGGTKKPTIEMLHNVDVIVFDMQDVGARFYTYVSTMGYVMMSASEFDKQMIVLDRPNPINGSDIEGPVLDMSLISFLGLIPIPVRHGMTIGEIANMMVKEGLINPSSVNLTVIPMEGWKRTMWFDETALPWISPSPNMRTLSTATVYPGTCLFEATLFTEGRGTERPFEYIGAPGVNKDSAASRLNKLKLPGVTFAPIAFTPKADPVAAPAPKFKDKLCEGVYVKVKDRAAYRPVLTGIMMLTTFKQMYPKKFQFKQGLLDRLVGDTAIGERVLAGTLTRDIMKIFKTDVEHFKKVRKKYLLYR